MIKARPVLENISVQGGLCDVYFRGAPCSRNGKALSHPHQRAGDKKYLHYLDERHISWIACGREKTDLVRAAEILAEEFHVERMGIVCGAAINTAFLDAGLLDEISIVVGAGIDGRDCMVSVFDGLGADHPLIHLKLMGVKR